MRKFPNWYHLEIDSKIRSLDGKSNGTPPGMQDMGSKTAVLIFVLAMAAVIVGVDLLIFRNRFWDRLIVNIGLVLVFLAFYLRFFRPH